jgi:hypothetical protein
MAQSEITGKDWRGAGKTALKLFRPPSQPNFSSIFSMMGSGGINDFSG